MFPFAPANNSYHSIVALFQMPSCSYCGKGFSTESAVSNHQSKDRRCLTRCKQARLKILNDIRDQHSESATNTPPEVITAPSVEFNFTHNISDSSADNVAEQFDVNAQTPSYRATVEEAPESNSQHNSLWDKPFPLQYHAGQMLGGAKTLFEQYRDEQVLQGAEVLGPFENDAEWELAKWLIKNVGHNQAEKFLKLDIVSTQQA